MTLNKKILPAKELPVSLTLVRVVTRASKDGTLPCSELWLRSSATTTEDEHVICIQVPSHGFDEDQDPITLEGSTRLALTASSAFPLVGGGGDGEGEGGGGGGGGEGLGLGGDGGGGYGGGDGGGGGGGVGHIVPSFVVPEDATTLDPKVVGIVPHSAAFPLTASRDRELMPVPQIDGRVAESTLLIKMSDVTDVMLDHALGKDEVSELYARDIDTSDEKELHCEGRELEKRLWLKSIIVKPLKLESPGGNVP